jgi:hypothetical protein
MPALTFLAPVGASIAVDTILKKSKYGSAPNLPVGPEAA